MSIGKTDLCLAVTAALLTLLAGCGHRVARVVYYPRSSATAAAGTLDDRVRAQALAAAPQAEEVGATYKAFCWSSYAPGGQAQLT